MNPMTAITREKPPGHLPERLFTKMDEGMKKTWNDLASPADQQGKNFCIKTVVRSAGDNVWCCLIVFNCFFLLRGDGKTHFAHAPAASRRKSGLRLSARECAQRAASRYVHSHSCLR